MEPVHTNPDGSRYRWDGEQWVPMPPEPTKPRGLVFGIVLVTVAMLALVMVGLATNAVYQRVTSGGSTTTATSTRAGSTTTRSGQSTTTTRRSGDQTPPANQSGEAALADDSFFVTFLPELRSAKAPSWVQQGTRITYYSAAASVPQSYHRYVEDEDGLWTDPTTGENYRREDIQSAAGHGYNEVNVTALNDAVAALNIRAYGLQDIDRSSPVSTLTFSGAVGLPGAGADWWLAPEVLAGIEETVTSDLKIVRMPYTAEGKTYSSIWLQSLSDRGNYTWVYDLDSGVLLHTASATQGPPITGPVAQGEGREGSTFLTTSTLVNIRRLSMPWVGSSAPSWIGSKNHVDYQGTVTAEVGSQIPLDATVAVDRKASGSDWARYTYARTLYSTVAPSVTEGFERVDGPGQVGGLFLPPDAIGGLSAGDELDHDPVTNVDVSVAAASGSTVTIRESGPGEVSELTYDAQSGLLVAWSTQNPYQYQRSDFQISGQP